jgi:hypothetical protein
MFNGKAIMSEEHFLPRGKWYLQTRIVVLLGMNQYEILSCNPSFNQLQTSPVGSLKYTCSRE